MAGGREVVRAKKGKRLPVVMTPEEVWRVIEELDGACRLAAVVMYGSGLRLMECLNLRVKDVDFGASQVAVRRGKGDEYRMTVLAKSARNALESQLRFVKKLWKRDGQQATEVELPDSLARKYPSAAREWGWQWVFPATRVYRDSRGSAGDITCIRPCCSEPCVTRCGARGSRSA